jgi:hypothetical protein
VKPALITRFGGAGTLVWPNWCLTVTAPPPGWPLAALFDEHAATTNSPAAPATPKNLRRLTVVTARA